MNDLPTRRAFARAGAAEIDRIVTAAVEEIEQDKAARHAAAKAAHEQAERERHHYTRVELEGARAVRDGFGWHKVTRVNRTTVSVATSHSWVDRITFEKILEVRS